MKVKKIKVSSILLKLTYSVACCALGWYLHGRFAPGSSAGFVQETPHVLVSDLSKSDTSAKKKYIAEVEAINSVDIVPQVSGYLEEILFKDGAFVEKDQNIFIIEQRKYKADVQAAEAAVKQLEAEFKRKKTLHKGGYVSDKEKDIAESNLEQAKAALDMAKLNLEHTEIKSPISGYIGKALITTGNLAPILLSISLLILSEVSATIGVASNESDSLLIRIAISPTFISSTSATSIVN